MHNFENFVNIKKIDTQVRYLPLIKQILVTLGSSTLSIKILEKKLQEWSLEKMKTSEFYRNHNGILTHKNSDQPTTAFKYYLDLLIELNLITRLNDFVRCSKFGLLFNSLHKLLDDRSDFSDFEKMFYLFFIFSNDKENLLLVLDFIFQQNKPVSQSEISKKYKTLLKHRLEHIYYITDNESVRDKYLSLLKEEKENVINSKITKTVSKHNIPPRLEWLADLGIVEEIIKDVFILSTNGVKFYNSIPKNDLKINKISIIDNNWIFENAISSFALLFENKVEFKNLSETKQNKLISDYILSCYEQLNTDSVSRISTLPAFIFISIMLFSKENIIINFTEIKNKLLEGIEIDEFQYSIRDAQRINESYILVLMK